MKAKTITTIIRISLSIGLCYGIYTETGIWTTLFAILVGIVSEINAKTANKNFKDINEGVH